MTSLSSDNPLAYMGVRAKNPPNVIEAARAPTVNDRKYLAGSLWLDTVTNGVYAFCDVEAGNAIWTLLGGSGLAVDSLLGDAGTAVPLAGDITIAGGTNMATAAAANTVTINLDAQIELTSVECGTNLARISTYATNLALIQAFADDDTAAGAIARNAVYGNMQVTAGDGNNTSNGVQGTIDVASGANVATGFGVRGLCEQADGSVIASTAAGTEGHLNLLETDAADLPQVYGFGVKGYLDAADTTAAPAAGIFAGIGSVVEYNTPFNGVAYGMAVSRLDAGGGAGTAGLAAYGVVQGTVAAADWLYGLDLYNGAAGVAYTTADIRLFNESTIAGTAASVIFDAAAGIDYRVVLGDAIGANDFAFEDSGNNDVVTIGSRGDIAARNINVTNTNLTTFNVNPILQSIATTGAAPTGATGDYNVMYMQNGVTMEQFILGAGQTIIAPRLADDGLLISLDLAVSEGAEYYFGHTTRSRHAYTIGTDGAFFVEATFKVADCGASDPLWLGFRILGAPNAAFATYTDAGVIGLHNTTGADLVIIGSNLNNAGWAYVDSTDAWLDGEAHKLRVNVSAAGVVTYLIDDVAPSVTQALTFDNGDVVIPFIHHLFSGAASGTIHLQQFACGLQ